MKRTGEGECEDRRGTGIYCFTCSDFVMLRELPCSNRVRPTLGSEEPDRLKGESTSMRAERDI